MRSNFYTDKYFLSNLSQLGHNKENLLPLGAERHKNSFIVLKKWPLAKREASPNPMELFTPFAFSVILLNDIPLLNISTIMFSVVNVIKKT